MRLASVRIGDQDVIAAAVTEESVSVSIEGLGRQENPVIVEDKALARWRLN